MSFSANYNELRKKRKKETESDGSFSGNYNALRSQREDDIAPVSLNTNTGRMTIAPVENEKAKSEEEKERKWFDAGAFEDGYQFGDVLSTVVGTAGDVLTNTAAGILGMGESIVDAGAYVAGGVGKLFGADDFAEDTKDFIADDLYDEKEVAASMLKGLYNEDHSVLGDKSDSLIQSGGQLLATVGLQAVGVPWFLTTGATSFGSEVDNAFDQGATYGEAGGSALISAGAEILTEKLSGGIKFGGKTLDDVLLKPLTQKISSKTVRTLTNLGLDALGEGTEEVISSVFSNLGSSLYKEESIDVLLTSEEAMDEYLESFIGGAVLGGGVGGFNATRSIKTGRDYKTGLTENEQKVVDNVYKGIIAEAEKDGKKLTSKEKSKLYDDVLEELKKGGIDTDTIESVLGGDTYKSYQDTVNNETALAEKYSSLVEEYNTLNKMKFGDMTGEQSDRKAELKEQIKELEAQILETQNNSPRGQLKSQLSEEVYNSLTRQVGKHTQTDNYLIESYNERARRGQAFEADVSKYDSKQADIVKKAIDSGVLNNTRRTHELVDMVAKISADKGVLFDFTNNAKLKESSFAIDGATVNGYFDKANNTIGVNVNSKKLLNTVVGHEVTHVLEGTELYAELQKAVTEYAKTKGDYQGRYDALKNLYKDVDGAELDAEITADLVGDYLFTDSDFVKSLSVQNRNVFQKIYDEIKYLYKVATAGSKEARELEKVKRAFDKAYKEAGKAEGDTKYSLSMVEAVQPTSDKWRRTLTTEEAKARFPKLWDVTAEESEVRNPTQISSTVNSYRKVYNFLKSEGFDGTILDASSGLGYGTRAGIEEYGFNVDDIEPYPDKSYNPKYRDYSALDKKYDVVISNAVLNVLPQDQRDALVVKMGEMLNEGGRIFINVRGKDVDTLASNEANTNISPMEWFVDSTGSYQKGFTKPELVAYLQDALGEGFTVKPTNMFGAVSAVVTKDGGVKYSLSDSDGKQLTKEQQEYFKDSKMRDDNGNLKVMYHGSQDAGFHTFDANMSDDDTSFFFVDRNDVAASYSGTTETYEAQTIRSAEDMNNFIESIGVEGYEVVEKDGKFTLLYEGDRVADSNTAQGIYDEFCWYEGVGEGDANYKVYLNLTNPLEIDAKGRPWNKIDAEFSQEVYDKYQSLTAEEKAALTDLAEWEDFRLFNSEIQEAQGNELASAYEKMGEDCNIYDLFSVAADNFSEESLRENSRKYLKTRDFAQRAKEQGYDGVIFKNIVDNGGYSNGSEGASTVAIAFESNQIKSVANEKPTGNADIRYSLSDSEGTKLTKEQQEFFKDSKIRNANGNLKVMHHGSFETFTVFDKRKAKTYGTFGNGFYFTDSTSHAGTYGKTIDVYLNITNPLQNGTNDITKEQIRKFVEALAENEDYGIDNYGYDATIDSVTDIVWGKGDFGMIMDLNITCVGNMVEAIELFNEVNGTDYNGIVVPTETVAFYPNQIKSIDNKVPTADPDIRFSLSEAVEETRDLMAIHNLHTNEVLKQLKLGGMPYPSVAITNPEKISHDGFGEVSVILRKDAIDPKNSKYNKIYGADAYTPTFPRIDYVANREAAERINDKVIKLYDTIPEYYKRSLTTFRDYTNTNDMLNSNRGEQGLIERYANDYGMKQLYLAEKGETVPMEIDRIETQMTDTQKELYQNVVDKMGADVLKAFNEKGDYDKIGFARIAWLEEHGEKLKDVYSDYWSGDGLVTKAEAVEIANEQTKFYWHGEIRRALEYLDTGGVTVEEKENIASTNAKIDEKIDSNDFKSWLSNLFNGIEETSGIRNNKDIFTPSGNRRSFTQTHDPVTIDNVIKAMRGQEQTGQGAFGSGNIQGASAQEYKSIAEVKKNAGRLGKMDEAEHNAITKRISEQILDIADRYSNGKDVIDAKATICEAVSRYETKAGIANYLKQYDYVYKYTDSIGDDIIELRDYIRNLPTPYFEAKPRRAVGFDEVGVFVIPRNADVKLKQELLNRGYAIAEYDPDIEGDRQKVVNSFEEYKFSLSDVNETPQRYGNFHISGDDVRLEAPTKQTLAPAQETVSKMEQVAPAQDVPIAEENIAPEDYAPITEEEANRLQSENVRSFSDADVPPETEAPYYEGSDTTRLDDDVVKYIASKIEGNFGIKNNEKKALREIIQRYSTAEIASKEDLFNEIREHFGERTEVTKNEYVVEAKRQLRRYKLFLSPTIKGDIPDFNEFRKHLFGRINTSVNGIPVDSAYAELNELYPDLFPGDIDNPTDQFYRMIEVAYIDPDDVRTYTISDEEIQEATDHIANEVTRYKNKDALRYVEISGKALMDEIAPPQAERIIDEPVKAAPEQSIKTVKERLEAKLSNAETELAKNKQLQRESLADYNAEIQRLKDEYELKVNKNTKAANDLLRRITRTERLRDSTDADYAKRISDLEQKQSKISEEVRTGRSSTEERAMRGELHQSIIDRIRAKFAEKGSDFDEVLKNAKNLSTFATVDNTPQRVMEKSLGYKEGQILADETVNKVAQNETEGIKWLNSFTDRKNGLLAKISKQYNIKPGSKESAAAQMYAEGFYVDENGDIIKYGDAELAKDFPDAKVQSNIKGLAGDKRIRQIYDDTLNAINESRVRNAYPEIQKLDNYFLHFRAMDDTFSRLGLPFNPNDIRAKDLPTDLNGVTADLKPGQPYFASAKHREGKRTSFDLLGGLERYLTSAKNQIYHIDDIQTLRALRNYIADTYGQANGLEGLDALDEDAAQEKIKQVYNSHLSTFAKFLNEEANVIAGKTALIDRGLEGIIGRRGITFIDTINKQVGSNMVGLNVSSSLTNFLAGVQAIAKTNKLACVKALAQTTSSKIGSIFGKSDSFVENNPTLIRRKGAERFYRTPFQKAGDAGYVLMSAVDNVTTEFIVRAKYNEYIKQGMSEQQAITEADKWASRLMGDRSLGQMPQIYNSKMLGLITKFQLEVRNQLDSQFYDTIKETKASNENIKSNLERNAKTAAKVTATFVELAVLQHLFGKAFESVAGYNPAFDIIEVLIKTLGFDDDEDDEDTALDNVEEGFLALLEDLPYTSTFTGGRIPISSALPIEELIKGEDEYGNEKSRLETLGEAAPYYVLPTGYGQIKKTVQGLSMFSDEHPVSGSYTDSGNLRFPVEDTLGNRVQAGIFGQWANKNARDYFDNDYAPLKEKQIQEYIDVDLPIEEYREYREGLSGLSTLEEKADYINSLDLPIEKKNLLINNIADRKEDIDLSDYEDYESLEEFDFAQEYADKYEFLQEKGISYAEYKNFDEDTKDAYDWAFKNQDKLPLAKAVANDVVTYRQYASELYDIKADKDSDGKSIVGSRKEKVIEYINNLDADYGERLILFKNEYNADDTYNQEIIDYLNSREDISYDEMKSILTELGFTVDSNGNIYWD